MIGLNRAAFVAAATLAAFLQAGCGIVAETAPVQAAVSGGPVRSLAEKAGAATDVPTPKPFVVDSRRPISGPIPVGVTPPDRKLKPRDPKGVEALTKELEATDRAIDAKARAQ